MSVQDLKAKPVSAAELSRALERGEEIAILDVRPEGFYSRGHMLYASCLPANRMEMLVDRLVPRRDCPVVAIDEAGEAAPDAAAKLARLGYSTAGWLEGGMKAWTRAGHVSFSGTNVPGKALGELVEHELGTPFIEAAELKRRLDAGEDIVVLDSRPLQEFTDFSIPGAVSCPTAELVYRYFETVRSPDTLVVVNCAGRTRSIIGAQTLVNAGVPNRVVSLRNSTMGWLFEGYRLDRGRVRTAPAPSAQALARARSLARALGQRAGVRHVDRDGLDEMVRQSGERTLYLFDVRTPMEYRSGHLPGARLAEGGQLVQAYDEYAGTRNARVVLTDFDGVRAVVVASWLRQLGIDEVYVYDAGSERRLDTGDEALRILGERPANRNWLQPDVLAAMLEQGEAAVFDIESTVAFRQGHIPGARFAARDELERAARTAGPRTAVVVTSSDGILAGVAAADLAAAGIPAAALLGGTRAWRSGGWPLETSAEPFAPDTDVWYGPYAYSEEETFAAFRRYLDWEATLVDDLRREGDTRIRARNLNPGQPPGES